MRVVFFGMNGGFSTVILSALAHSDSKPELVIHGFQPTALTKEMFELRSTRPTFLQKMKLRKTPSPSAPPPVEDDEHTVRDEHEIDLTRAAERHGIDVVCTMDANRAKVRAKIATAEPDVFVIAGFPHLLSKDVLRLAKKGGLNLHPGKLPAERGPSPLFWALKAGRTTIGYTIHVLDEGEDSGDIVAGGEVSFDPGTDGEEILTRTARLATPQLIRSLRALIAGDIVRSPQPKSGHGRCPRPTFRDGLIDVSRSALEVFTFVAGCARTNSIFVECGGDRFFIERAVSHDMEAKLAFEFVLTGDRLILRCNPGVVELVLKEQGALFSAEY
jgi:methionyl-tRNA formyltransferase